MFQVNHYYPTFCTPDNMSNMYKMCPHHPSASQVIRNEYLTTSRSSTSQLQSSNRLMNPAESPTVQANDQTT